MLIIGGPEASDGKGELTGYYNIHDSQIGPGHVLSLEDHGLVVQEILPVVVTGADELPETF
ncbi:hypothetical protein JS82_08040 [Methanomassiliicoccaceae archaeon DOK]|nr:hypothetical protein JS82_08040 [Methanomassiliicoccaceae archaeon DOK]